MLEVKNLTKNYGPTKVLRGVDLKCEPGKIYGIVGENGAGKTTLFRCLAGFEKHGGAVVRGRGFDRSQTGYLPTEPVLLSRITGWEYLKTLCLARDVQRDDFTARNPFELPLERYAETYSTGMKKKLALTAILLQQNNFFLLDEPFNGVDIHSNIVIVELLSRLRAAGRTVLISSHIFATLRESCDEIHFLREGRLEEKYLPAEFARLEERMRAYVVGEGLEGLLD